MKRIHLFEFEDLSWFPSVLRTGMTRLIVVMHRLFGTSKIISELLPDLLRRTGKKNIVDLCSGSCGPMIDVLKELRNDVEFADLQLTLTDLYPPHSVAKEVENLELPVHYRTQPVDATKVPNDLQGLRTMICSFHHMEPSQAKKILQSAVDDRQPIFIFELSDNSVPMILPFLFSPINFLMALFITPLVRPLTISQLFFTYLVPLIPLGFAWDGVVSNARTYTESDIQELLKDVSSENYHWQTKLVGTGSMKKICLIGHPIT